MCRKVRDFTMTNEGLVWKFKHVKSANLEGVLCTVEMGFRVKNAPTAHG